MSLNRLKLVPTALFAATLVGLLAAALVTGLCVRKLKTAFAIRELRKRSHFNEVP